MTSIIRKPVFSIPAIAISCLLFGVNVSANDVKPETDVMRIAQQDNTEEKPISSDEKAETAREAYKEEDAKPVENWFGCPPTDKADADSENQDEDSATVTVAKADTATDQEQSAAEPSCDPEAPENQQPQKEEESTQNNQ